MQDASLMAHSYLPQDEHVESVAKPSVPSTAVTPTPAASPDSPNRIYVARCAATVRPGSAVHGHKQASIRE